MWGIDREIEIAEVIWIEITPSGTASAQSEPCSLLTTDRIQLPGNSGLTTPSSHANATPIPSGYRHRRANATLTVPTAEAIAGYRGKTHSLLASEAAHSDVAKCSTES